jgi:hypothetical protein
MRYPDVSEFKAVTIFARPRRRDLPAARDKAAPENASDPQERLAVSRNDSHFAD